MQYVTVFTSFAEVFKVYNYERQIDVFGLPLVDLIGVFTLLIVLLTLYASLRAVRETARANMLSSLPIITLSYDYDKDEVIVENNGSGVAVNVKVDNFYNWWADKTFNLYGLTKIVFTKISILKHGEKQILQATIRGVTDPLGLTKFVMFSKNQKPLYFAIKFSDLSGQRYITEVKIEQGNVDIVSSPCRLNLLSRAKLVLMRSRELITMLRFGLKVKMTKRRDDKEKQKNTANK